MASFPSYRRFIALLLLVSVFAQTFRNSFIVLDYYLNTGWYMRNCQYKERTVTMHCFGKCSVVKKIKEEKNRDEQNPMPRLDNRTDLVYFEHFYCPVPAVAPVREPAYTYFPPKDTRDMIADHFHPPQLA